MALKYGNHRQSQRPLPHRSQVGSRFKQWVASVERTCAQNRFRPESADEEGAAG
jgi:hypothetical protein